MILQIKIILYNILYEHSKECINYTTMSFIFIIYACIHFLNKGVKYDFRKIIFCFTNTWKIKQLICSAVFTGKCID